MTEETTGVFIGRFQPFHNGHLEIVEEMIREVDNPVILIGSMQKSGTEENPYDFQTRFNMIRNTLRAQIPSFFIYKIGGVSDADDDNVWIDGILRTVGDHIDIVYTGNKAVKRIFKKQGIKVKFNKLRPRDISGTKIRKLMRIGEKWDHLVPDQVVEVIKCMK